MTTVDRTDAAESAAFAEAEALLMDLGKLKSPSAAQAQVGRHQAATFRLAQARIEHQAQTVKAALRDAHPGLDLDPLIDDLYRGPLAVLEEMATRLSDLPARDDTPAP